jgi:hypothetical protein
MEPLRAFYDGDWQATETKLISFFEMLTIYYSGSKIYKRASLPYPLLQTVELTNNAGSGPAPSHHLQAFRVKLTRHEDDTK